MEDLSVIIMAAGKGIRFNSETPKLLHQVCGKPIFQHVLESVSKINASKIIVVVGYNFETIKNAFKDFCCEWIIQTPQDGTGRAVLAAENLLQNFKGNILVLNGDMPLLEEDDLRDFINFHNKSKANVSLVYFKTEKPQGYGRIVQDKKGFVTRIIEDCDATEKQRSIKKVNAGMYIFPCPEIFFYLKKLKNNNAKQEYFLTDVIKILSTDGLKISAYEMSEGKVKGVNDRRELAEVSNIMRRRNVERHLGEGVTIVAPEHTHIECDVEIGQDTVIHPYTIIRKNVKIGKRCVIGPFVQLRPGTILKDDVHIGNFTEVKNSVIGEGSKANHLTYIGDAEIGRNVNVGAGTITANYDGVKKNKTIIGNDVQIGSGSIFVAPVKVGDRSKTGAGAIVVKNKDVPPDTTVVGVPAKPLKKNKE